MTDEEMMDGIAEFRALRSIVDNTWCRTEKEARAVIGNKLFDRMMYLNEATWPARNEKFKAFNDARL